MSFAYEIKQEISQVEISARHCRISMLAGMLLCGTLSYDEEGLSFITEHKFVAMRAFSLIHDLLSLSKNELRLANGKHNCRVSILGAEGMKKLLLLYKIKLNEDFDGRILNIVNIDLNRACCKRSIIMGCFMGGGSLSDPNKSYHFEIVARSEFAAELISNILNEFEVRTKVIRRKDNYIVYAKDSESLASVLLVMSASASLMRLENIRINKQVRNSINREVNFEASNLGKTGRAADKQMGDIHKISEILGLSSLDEHLMEVVRLRLDNPESSLKELSEISGNLSKSCINHRFRRIGEIAKNLED